MEKKKSIVFKKIIVSILSILFVVCAYLPCVPKVKALTNVITYNNYGSFSRTNEAFGLSATTRSVNLGCSSVVGELNGIYNGTVTINYSIGNGLSIANFSVIPENCHIISYSSSACTIEFYGVSNWTVTFLETQTKNVASLWEDLTIQSLTNWNMTYLERSDSAVMVNIQNRLTDLKTYTDQLESLMTTNNQLLQTIANNGGSGGSSTVNNIDINVDHIADELSLLKTSNDSILDELLGFFTDGLGQIITIESVVDAIEDTTTALLGVQNQLTSIGTTLNTINSTLTQINNSVSNIDNSIDTITWNNRSVVTYKYLSGDGTFKNVTDNNYSGINHLLTLNMNFATINRGTNNYISKIRLGDNAQFTDYFEVTDVYYLINNSKVHVDYYQQNNNEVTLYVYNYNLSNNNHSTAPLYIEVKIPQNKYLTIYPLNASCGYIFDTDIEYWTLIQCFNDFNMQKQILDAIKNTSVNITQNDITEMNTNINEYNSTMTDINQIENNYINNFNTLNNGIDLSNNSTPSVNLIDARTRFNGVFNDITGDLRIRGILILVLVCGLILILLGA